MGKTLLLLEVSQKQAYIFSSRKLSSNIARSEEIAYVTSSAFFQKAAAGLYDEAENLVYAGGGHTVLQFESRETAACFAKAVTKAALEAYPDMELFARQLPYDSSKTPGQNLNALSAAMEEKKALRQSVLRQLSFGLEQETPLNDTSSALAVENRFDTAFPSSLVKVAGDEGFIGVIHIDGNAMGKRVQKLYEEETDWERCRQRLQEFSRGIDRDFRSAFDEMVETVRLHGQYGAALPIRPVILAGDDVCFVARASIALECARVFLEALSKKTNCTQTEPYAACAGVCFVHKKAPFHQAYNMAEALCSSAKRFGSAIDPGGSLSCLDWHIEYGQLKRGLEDIREGYLSDDGDSVTCRPVAVVVPKEFSAHVPEGHTYAAFQSECRFLKNCQEREKNKISRAKIKGLREILKQGKNETAFYLTLQKATELSGHQLFDAIELYDLAECWEE